MAFLWRGLHFFGKFHKRACQKPVKFLSNLQNFSFCHFVSKKWGLFCAGCTHFGLTFPRRLRYLNDTIFILEREGAAEMLNKFQFRRGSIQLRIIGLALAFTLSIALTVILSSVHSLEERLERNTLQAAEYALQTAATAIGRDVEAVDSLADWCATDATVRTYMLSDVSSKVLLQSVYPTVSNKYNSLRSLPYVQRFLLTNDKGRYMMFGTIISQSVVINDENLWLLPGLGDEDGLAWQNIVRDPLMLQTMSVEGIPVTRTLHSLDGKRTAYAYISVSPQMITSPLRDFTLAEGGQLYWVMGGMVYRVQENSLVLLGAAQELVDCQPHEGETLDPDTSLYTAQIEGETCLIVAYPLGVHGLYLVETIPNGPLRRQLPLMFGPLLISLLAILLLGSCLAGLLHRVVANPIAALQRQIETISRGDFTTDPGIEWENELGDIGRGINNLSRSVTELMDKRLEDERQKQDLEYRMLQNQINPHFIYNTLNSVKWMATIQHAPGIAEMVTALSRLLKSVSKGNERLVPLYEEFALLNDYVTIQQYRYGGTITLDVSYIENERMTHTCMIPRFTLQPLVENAIFHGIEPKGCVGTVDISVVVDQATGDVLLHLTDNGVGMTPAQAVKALQPPGPEEEAAKFRHVGMWNVHRRLQYSFGEAYGLAIQSTPGEGTTVTVRLPSTPPQQPPGKEEAP